MQRRHGCAIAITTAILMLTSGCNTPASTHGENTTTTTPTERSITEQVLSNVRWIPNPAVDLMSPEGTFIRAASESYARIAFGRGRGEEAIADAGYPGFLRAFNNVADAETSAGNGDKTRTWVGTAYSEVVNFRRDGGSFTAEVCSYGSMSAYESDGNYVSAGSTPSWGAGSYTFGPDPRIAAADQHEPPRNQRGPARTPSTDVFGTWVLTNVSTVELPQCAKLAPDTPMTWPPEKYVRPDPPPTLPPSPGWPEAPTQ